jgi:hypothetical protein
MNLFKDESETKMCINGIKPQACGSIPFPSFIYDADDVSSQVPFAWYVIPFKTCSNMNPEYPIHALPFLYAQLHANSSPPSTTDVMIPDHQPPQTHLD